MVYVYNNSKEGNPLEEISDDTMFMLKIPVQRNDMTIFKFAGPFFDVHTAK